MSPLKRTARASAKQAAGRGRHARPSEPPAAALDVPAELRPTDYGFPPVHLPSDRPHVTRTQLLTTLDADQAPTEALPVARTNGECQQQHRYRIYCAALDATVGGAFGTAREARIQYDLIPEDDEPIWDVIHADGSYCVRESQRQEVLSFGEPAVVGRVLDGEPKPAQHAGLEPIPVPSLPFLNAGAHVEPQQERTEAVVREGSALPPRLTGAELVILGQRVPNDAPAVAPRLRRPGGVSHTFDDGFWSDLHRTMARAHAVAETLTAGNDRLAGELAVRLARLDRAHRDALAQHEAPTLPRRVPGASLAAIETGRGELAVAR